MPTPVLKLNGFTFAELFQAKGLHRLDQTFLSQLQAQSPALHEQLLSYRNPASEPLGPEATSELLLACSPLLEEFLIKLFDIEEAAAITRAKTLSNNPVGVFKEYFVLRRAKKQLLKAASFPSFEKLNAWL